MAKGRVASARVTISAPVAEVWDALVNPEIIKQYMFGTTVVSDWREGSTIVWKGLWKGKAYEDKGTILRLEPRRVISYNHFSPLAGLADVPENYHIVTTRLSQNGDGTSVSLSQDNNTTEEARVHSERNWKAMLDGLKELLEKG